MLRLPADVVRALRRRATTADITIAEAARQLMLPRNLKDGLGLLEHVQWLHSRLLKRRADLIGVFQDAIADAEAVDTAIDALGELQKQWPDDSYEDEEFITTGMG